MMKKLEEDVRFASWLISTKDERSFSQMLQKKKKTKFTRSHL